VYCILSTQTFASGSFDQCDDGVANAMKKPLFDRMTQRLHHASMRISCVRKVAFSATFSDKKVA